MLPGGGQPFLSFVAIRRHVSRRRLSNREERRILVLVDRVDQTEEWKRSIMGK